MVESWFDKMYKSLCLYIVGVDTNIIVHNMKHQEGRRVKGVGMRRKDKWKRVPPLPQVTDIAMSGSVACM